MGQSKLDDPQDTWELFVKLAAALFTHWFHSVDKLAMRTLLPPLGELLAPLSILDRKILTTSDILMVWHRCWGWSPKESGGRRVASGHYMKVETRDTGYCL